MTKQKKIMQQTDLIIGKKRKASEFPMGTKDTFEIMRDPIIYSSSLSHNYCVVLNYKNFQTRGVSAINDTYERDPKMVHFKTRNCLHYSDPILFEASGSNVKMIKDCESKLQWDKMNFSISTRSRIKGLSINKDATFGFVNTISKPAIFSVNSSSGESKFGGVSFITEIEDDNILDFQTSDFITGESLCITKNNEIKLFNKEESVFSAQKEGDTTWNYSCISFLSNPRVAVAGFEKSIDIIDTRKKDPFTISISTPLTSSFLPLDSPFRIAAANHTGISFYDMRFPSKPEDIFVYHFETPVSSMKSQILGNFNVIFASCCESSDVIAFPYNNTEFSAALLPFDTKLVRYDYMDSYSLTGMEIISSNVFVQYENQCVLKFDLSPTEPSRSFFVPIAERSDYINQKDVFHFTPHIDTTAVSSKATGKKQASNPNWNALFPEISQQPPSDLLNQNIPPIAENEEMDGYLTDIADALEFGDDELDEILPAIFQHHVNTIRQIAKNESKE